MQTYSAERVSGSALVVLAAIAYSTGGILVKVAYASGASTEAVLFLRFLLAGPLMALLMTVLRLSWPKGRDLLILIFMGAVGFVGQAFCYYSALRHASAGLSVLLLYVYPTLVTLISALMGRQRLTWLKLGAVCISLLGIILTVADGLAGNLTGILFGSAAAVFYAGFIVMGEGVSSRIGAIPASTVVILTSSVVFGAVVATGRATWPSGPAGWSTVAVIAVFSTVVAMVTFFAGAQRLGATDAATLSTLEPVITLLLSAFFLGESLTPLKLGGAVLVVGAVVILARYGGATERHLEVAPRVVPFGNET